MKTAAAAKVRSRFPRSLSLATACGYLLLAVSVLSPGPSARAAALRDATTSEACILCHIELFNAGLKQAYIHGPFFDRQCVVCHLPDGGATSGAKLPEASTLAGSGPGSQEEQWSGVEVFRDEWQSLDHLVQVPGLQATGGYRFRVAIGSQPDLAASISRWFELRLTDFPTPDNGPAEISVSLSDDAAIGTEVPSVKLVRLASSSVLFSWDTSRPCYGWVELQEANQGTNSVISEPASVYEPRATVEAGTHPLLRDPEELAINACYQCHADSELGTSHPVRLYNGDGVRIPDNLPTVAGMLTCVTCHDPHGAAGRVLVRETIKTRLCVACHYTFKNSSPNTMFN